ncbi:hypothetical protein ACET3X_001568 [Alternaria dauci]|uniref:Uncharacterized protein n=1 Tax=Alternaria dauci TaxID=48095 RepID=A0ABR3UXQ6_9PLEO
MAPFRFLDLPREVRDNIYSILLCTFPPPDSITRGIMLSKEDFSPSILRVNKQIYSESYDIMIKGNRFVLVTSHGGLHFVNILRKNDVPILALEPVLDIKHAVNNYPSVQSFRGHAVHVTIGNSEPKWEDDLPPSPHLRPAHMVMLFRDLEFLCHAIMEGDDLLEDYMDVVLVGIHLAPVAKDPPFQLEALTTYFSSTKIQEQLLEPFRRGICNQPRVDIGGIIEKSLAQSALDDFARDKFEDADALIESWTAIEARGTKLFNQGNRGCLKH